MLNKNIFIYVLLLSLFCSFISSKEILIISKVNDDIITNIDIENEKKYLLLLNKNLDKLSKHEIFDLAKNSLIREKIKKKETDRLFEKTNDKIENKIIKNFYNKIGFDKEENFIDFLENKKINFQILKEKLLIEALWNQLIYNNFNEKIRIDEILLQEKIIEYYKSKEKKYEYKLSEIVIENVKDIEFKKKEIYKYINEFGFKVAANKYSKSDTSKYGGDIGWIKGTRLSNNIKNKISKIKIDQVSEPIQISNGYLFLQLNNKKKIEEKYDLKKELKQQINFEKNRQLKQYSLNYYKKLKKNTSIYENK